MAVLAAHPHVLIDSTLTLLIVNRCWANQTDCVLDTLRQRTAAYLSAAAASSSEPAAAMSTPAAATGAPSVGPVLRARHDGSIAPLASGPGASVAPVAVPWGKYARLVPTADDIAALRSGTLKTVYAHWDDSEDAAASGWYLATVVKSYDAASPAPEFDFKVKYLRALLLWSTSPILRELWRVLVMNANDLLDADHQIGPEASVRVLQTVMQYNFLSIQKTYRIGGLNAIPDHFNKDSLRSQLRHTPLKLVSELSLIAKTVGVPAAELQHYLLAVNLGGGGSGRGQDSCVDAAAAARQRTALSAATGAVNAQDCACDYTVTLESSDHGIIFGRSDRGERQRQRQRSSGAGSASESESAGPAVLCQCVVASLPNPSASAGSAQSAKRVKLYDTLGIGVGDVVRSVSSFPSASDSRAATRRVDLDPIAFLVDGVVPYVFVYF
jgi:hypothetical protein